MSISPAQLTQQVVSEESPVVPRPRAPASPSLPPATPSGAQSLADSPAPAPAASPASPVRTDVRIDDQHQFYYEFVDKSTGTVEFEIPPEALRAIGETLNVAHLADSGASALDVKS